jgi:hypothetical protein
MGLQIKRDNTRSLNSCHTRITLELQIPRNISLSKVVYNTILLTNHSAPHPDCPHRWHMIRA